MDGQDIVVKDIAMARPLKDGFAAAHISFSLPVGLHIIVIDCRKTFDSLLANHFFTVMQNSHGYIWAWQAMKPALYGSGWVPRF